VIGCWVGTPIGAVIIAMIVFKTAGAIYNRFDLNLFESDILLRLALIVAGSYAAYAIGANNVANVTAVFVGAGTLSVFSATLLGGLSIALGILTFSRRVMETVGKKIIRLDAFSALVVVLAEAITLHIYTVIGVPVSSSQAVIGAILGVGIVKGIKTVSRKQILNILIAWFLTPMTATLIAVILEVATHLQYVPGGRSQKSEVRSQKSEVRGQRTEVNRQFTTHDSRLTTHAKGDPMTNQNWNAQRLLQTSSSYWQGFTLHAAVKLDVFSVIGDDTVSANEIADRIKADERAMAMLLDALCAMELLLKNAGRYSNTSESATFLSRSSSQYLGYMLMHHHHLAESWIKLDQAVISGEPVRGRASFSDDQWRESFLMGMFNMAKHTAPRVAEAIDLAGRKHLLDLGGGPGTYAIFFCQKNPGLSATVFDLPTTRPFAETVINQFGLTDRISFSEGNYLNENIAGTYDVVWLSHVLHGEGPEGCEKIIRKAVAALRPGGMILIHDFILDNTMDSPLFPALFALNMLLGTASGQSYSEGQIREMLARSGVANIERVAMALPNDSGIIAGIV